MEEGWFFIGRGRRLRYGDGRIARVGVTHTVRGRIKPCAHGLHAAPRALTALTLGGGPVVFWVRLSGTVLAEGEGSAAKWAASRRHYLRGGIDVSNVLREFAFRMAMLRCSHLSARDTDFYFRTRFSDAAPSVDTALIVALDAISTMATTSFYRSAVAPYVEADAMLQEMLNAEIARRGK